MYRKGFIIRNYKPMLALLLSRQQNCFKSTTHIFVRYSSIFVESGKEFSLDLKGTKNVFQEKQKVSKKENKSLHFNPIIIDQYHECCRFLKKNENQIETKLLPSNVVYNLPRLSHLSGNGKNFVEEFISDWYVEFEKNLSTISPEQFDEIFEYLANINEETSGNLFKVLTYERTLIVIEQSLKHAKQESIFFKQIRRLIDIANATHDYDERFVSELKKTILIYFESFISTNAMNIIYHPRIISLFRRCSSVVHKMASEGLPKPSDVCLNHFTNFIIVHSTIGQTTIRFPIINKLKSINRTVNAFTLWNYDPGECFEGFWKNYFMSACHYHQCLTKYILQRLSCVATKFDIGNNKLDLLEKILAKDVLNKITIYPPHVKYASRHLENLHQEPLKIKDNHIVTEVLQSCKDLKAGRLDSMDASTFLSLPFKSHTLNLDQYFVDNAAFEWFSQLRERYDSKWIVDIVNTLAPLTLINRSTKGALMKIGHRSLMEYLSEMLATIDSNNSDIKSYILLAEFLCLNMHVIGGKSEKVSDIVEHNLLDFWEKCFINFDINEMPFMVTLNTFNSFTEMERAGTQKPSQTCLKRAINIFHEIDFVEDENNLFYTLKCMTNFSDALHSWNINADLYRKEFWADHFHKVLLGYEKLSANLCSDWVIAAMHFDRVRDLMEFKPYWWLIFNEKVLSKSKVEKLMKEKDLWAKKNLQK